MNDEILDINDVLERVQDDRELLMELLDIFVEDFLEKRKALSELIQQRDTGQIRNIVHSMKGASGNISAKAIHALCAKIEQWAEKGEIQQIEESMASLDEHFNQLQACIVKLKKKLT